MKSLRDGYGLGLLELGQENDQVVVLAADLAGSTRSTVFAEKYPERFVQCGVAEQNMMGVAAGLALGGKIPFVNSFAVFSPGRNWDQLRVSVCYSNLPVKIAGHHTGFSAAGDGATHQALEDIAITRVLPNLTVLSPADPAEARACVMAAAVWDGPVYIRLSKYNFDFEKREKRKEKTNTAKQDQALKGRQIIAQGVNPGFQKATTKTPLCNDRIIYTISNS